MSLSSHTLQQFVERARRLYSLPSVAVKVLELTSHPQVDLRALKDCIENDPALATKVLRVVNSSLFGLSREVADLKGALALLGLKPLKLLVLGFSLSEDVFNKFTGNAMLRYSRRTLTRATAARQIAETICHIPGDEPFIAALVQDIGQLVLLQELGEPYARLLSRPVAHRQELAGRETESLGFDHTELTGRLLANWGLPESLVSAVSAANSLTADAAPPANASPLVPILHLAGQLADLLVDARHELLPKLADSGAAGAALTQTQLSELISKLQDRMTQLCDVLSLELPAGLDYRDVLIQAHTHMSEISGELATELVKGNRPRTQAVCESAEMLYDVQALSTAVSQFIHRAGETDASQDESLVAAPPAAPPRPPSASFVAPAPRPVANSSSQGEGETGLLNRLALIAYACRQSRWALSLALVEIDRFPQLVLKHGPQQAARLARLVHDACRGVDVAQASCVPLRQYCIAVALPQSDRHQGAKLCNQLLQDIRRLVPGDSAPLTVSVGLASVDLPPKNFVPNTLIEAATRCLSAAQLSGGNTLKSIGIY